MKGFLVIVLLCVVGLSCGQEYGTRHSVRPHLLHSDVNADDRDQNVSRNADDDVPKVFWSNDDEVVPTFWRNIVTDDDVVNNEEVLSEPGVDSLASKNERVIKVASCVQKNLIYEKSDVVDKQKRQFTQLAYFYYLYFEANNGNYNADFTEAVRKYLEVKNRPAYVLVAPVRALVAKFVTAVSRRVAVVQKYCHQPQRTLNCTAHVESHDKESMRQCYWYYQNVVVHNLALANVASFEYLLEKALLLAKAVEKADETVAFRIHQEAEQHLLAAKEVYKVLKRFRFTCSYCEVGDIAVPLTA